MSESPRHGDVEGALPPVKRRRKLINTRLQLRLVLVFVGLAAVASLFQVFMVNRSILDMSKGLGAEREAFLGELPGVLSANLLLSLGVLVPVMLAVGILVTFRIAGPLYRMELHLKKLVRGQNPGPCSLREGDELQEFCSLLNRAVDVVREDATRSQPSASEVYDRAA